MEKKQVVESLKQMATKKVANDVFHAWALRDRTRQVVTVEALAQRMKKEGYDYPQHEYAAILRQLSNMGLGRLETGAGGKVRALKDVRLTLQSIGRAAVGDAPLKGWHARNRFGHLVTSTDSAPEIVQEKAVEPSSTINVGVTLMVTINDKSVGIQIPDNLTVAEVSALVAKLKGV